MANFKTLTPMVWKNCGVFHLVSAGDHFAYANIPVSYVNARKVPKYPHKPWRSWIIRTRSWKAEKSGADSDNACAKQSKPEWWRQNKTLVKYPLLRPPPTKDFFYVQWCLDLVDLVGLSKKSPLNQIIPLIWFGHFCFASQATKIVH